MKLVAKILLGIAGTGAAVAAVTIINPFGIASNVPGLQQARYGYILAATMTGTEPEKVASEKDICLASNMFSHGTVYEWYDEPQYIGIYDSTYGSIEEPSPDDYNSYKEIYENCVSWRPELSTKDSIMTFTDHADYTAYHDNEVFETFWHSDSTPYLAEQSATKNRKLTAEAQQRYDAWKQENGKE